MRMIGMPKNFIGARPGRVYSWGDSASIQTASGTAVTFPQAAERPLSGLNIYGHSTQDGTPSPENPVPIVSAGSSGQVNVSVGGGNLLDTSVLQNGGTLSFELISNNEIKLDVLIDGTYRQLKVFNMPIEEFKTSRTLYVKGNITSNSNPENIPLVVARLKNVNNESINTYDTSLNTSKNLEISNEVTYVEFVICANRGNTAKAGDTLTIQDLMISAVDVPYQPYVTPQTLTLSTPGGLPGIPVSSGGNYTDENGQQWICDEIDLKRGKYVQRVKKLVLDGTEAWNLRQNEDGLGLPYFFMGGNDSSGESRLYGYCNYFPVAPISSVGTEQGMGGWRTTIYLRWTELFSTVEDLKSFLSEKYTSGNPVRVYYILATPIETDLPAEEIAAYKALHTYTPNTSVGNDAGAWMKVGYKQ